MLSVQQQYMAGIVMYRISNAIVCRPSLTQLALGLAVLGALARYLWGGREVLSSGRFPGQFHSLPHK